MVGTFNNDYDSGESYTGKVPHRQELLQDLKNYTELSDKVLNKVINIMEDIPLCGVSIDTDKSVYLVIKYKHCVFEFIPREDNGRKTTFFKVGVESGGKTMELSYVIESELFYNFVIKTHHHYIDKVICANLFN